MKFTYFHTTLTLFSIFVTIPSILATPTLKKPTRTPHPTTTIINAVLATASLPVNVIHEFPHGTWVENLAVRSNGQILATIATAPELYQVDPTQVNWPILVHTFDNATGLTGIVETTTDIFYVLAGKGSPFEPEPYSFSVWTVNLLTSGKKRQVVPGVISKVANIPNGIFCNGMTVLSKNPDVLLIADSLAGLVWKLDVDSGVVTTAVQNPDMTADGNFPGSLGINGIKIRDGRLFWTDTDQMILASVPINTDGTAAGAVSILTDQIGPDDFVFDDGGNAFIAQDPNDSLLYLGTNGSKVVLTVSSGPNVIQGPTACQFGRTASDNESLYVTSNGGFAEYQYDNPVFTVGGRVSRVDVGAAGYL